MGGAFLLACIAVRLIALDADPPSWLSWSAGIYTDEGFYTLDARHEALFGAAAPGNFHDRLLSPLLSLLQQGIFHLFGVGMIQARLISVVFGLLTVAVLWLGLKQAYGRLIADLGALFLGLAPPFVFYNRMALQETPTVFWLVLAFALWAYRRNRAGLLAMAGASAAMAILFKPLAILAVPALLVRKPATAPPELGAGGLPAPPLSGGLLLAFALVIAPYVILWYLPHHAELSRMGTYYRTHQYQPHSLMSLWLNIRRGFVGDEMGWQRGVFPYLLALLPVPCLLAVRCVWRRNERNPADVFFAVWLVCGLLFCFVSSYAPSRYYVLFLPALAGLAARGVVGLRRPVLIIGVALFLLTSGFLYARALMERSYARQNASRLLSRVLPPGSIVIGDIAPALCMDMPFVAVPVQPGLSNDDHPIERLRATHVAVVRAPVWENWWQSHYLDVVQPSHRVAVFSLGSNQRYMVEIYRVR